jgi:hypothetical protein
MISEETFAREEQRLGKQVHFHDGVWWIKAAPFYYKPVHEFRPFPPGSARPGRFKALLGYSHQVPASDRATRHVVWNMLEGDNLKMFSMEKLKPAKQRAVRKGQRECIIQPISPTEENLEQMRLANISLAERCVGVRDPTSFLPADYYTTHAAQWREDMLKLFGHRGYKFIGAFVEGVLVAYINLITVEGTWIMSAIKSVTESLHHRPVDALYFSILSEASQVSRFGECQRVLNGGGDHERESLARFKAEFMLLPVRVPYYSRTLLPMERLRQLKSVVSSRRDRRGATDMATNTESH